MNNWIFEDIKKIIKESNPNDDFLSANILISGPWGSGKTTLKNVFLNEFKKLDEYIVLDINVWLEPYENLSEIIFEKLLEYGLITTDIIKQKEKIAKTIIKKFINDIKPLRFIKECIDEDKNYGFNEIIEEINEKNKIINSLHELINFILNNSNKKRKKLFFFMMNLIDVIKNL